MKLLIINIIHIYGKFTFQHKQWYIYYILYIMYYVYIFNIININIYII